MGKEKAKMQSMIQMDIEHTTPPITVCKKIYIITGLTELTADNLGWPDYGATRTFGYYITKDNAIESVKHNVFDIHETIYDYMLIEEVEEGLYNPSTIRGWFKYAGNNTYTEIPEPDFMKHFVGIGMG